MTQRAPFPLRRPGEKWPGTNTRGGKLDDGTGVLTDNSKNCMINQSDLLEKRKGFTRGLDEAFAGPVCGLFKYTDECGVEHLLVADETGIFIRQPFAVPVFENSDAYPFDSFQTADVNVNTWLNTLSYRQLNGQLQVVLGDNPDPLVWFKEATSSSYQVRIEFQFDEDSVQEQEVSVVIKAADATATAARIKADLIRAADSSTLTLVVSFTDANLNTSTLLSANAGTDATGFLTLSYNKETRVISIFYPEASISQGFAPLSVTQDVDLGQYSAIQVVGSTSQTGIKVVDGGPI